MEAFIEAFAAAMSEMEDPVRNEANEACGSRYATLEAVIAAIRKPLTRHGIAFPQFISVDGAVVSVTTNLMHKDGSLSFTMSMRAAGESPWEVASAISYARRYSLLAVCGLAQADDDAQAASLGRGSGRRLRGVSLAPEQVVANEDVAKEDVSGGGDAVATADDNGRREKDWEDPPVSASRLRRLVALCREYEKTHGAGSVRKHVRETYGAESIKYLSEAQAAEFEEYVRGAGEE